MDVSRVDAMLTLFLYDVTRSDTQKLQVLVTVREQDNKQLILSYDAN